MIYDSTEPCLDPLRSLSGLRELRGLAEQFCSSIVAAETKKLITNENWALCPMEIFFLLTFLANGSSENGDEILEALGILPRLEKNRMVLNELLSLLRHFYGDMVSESTSQSRTFMFYVIDKLSLNPQFVQLRESFYEFISLRPLPLSRIHESADALMPRSAEISPVTSPEVSDTEEEMEAEEESREQREHVRMVKGLNAILSKLTDGKLRDIIKVRFPIRWEAVEESYLMFQTTRFCENWRVEFPVHRTEHDFRFTPLQELIDATSQNIRSPGRRVLFVDMMCSEDYVTFLGTHEWKGVSFRSLSLTFQSSAFSFVLLLPENAGVKQLSSLLEILRTPSSFTRIREEQVLSRVALLRIPKFVIGTSVQLRFVLEGIGIKSPFSEDAGLYNIATSGLRVADIIQRTELVISENGIEVTGSDGGGGGGGGSGGRGRRRRSGLLGSNQSPSRRRGSSGHRLSARRGGGRIRSGRGGGDGSSSRNDDDDDDGGGGVVVEGGGEGSNVVEEVGVSSSSSPPAVVLPIVDEFTANSPFVCAVVSTAIQIPFIYAKVLRPTMTWDEDD